MKKNLSRLLALLMAMLMVVAMVGCGDKKEKEEDTKTTPAASPSGSATTEVKPDVPADRYDATTTPRTGANESTPLVISTLTLDGKFSPFFATSGYDTDVVGMTQIGLIGYDKDGAPVAGIDEYCLAYSYTQEVKDQGTDNETSEYTFVLKNGITFSDGTPITVKDVLFSFYTFLDPLYDGSSTLYTLDIQGLSEYRTQTTADVNAKYSEMAEKIYAAGLDSEGKPNAVDGVDAAMVEAYWSYLSEAGSKFAQEIIDYVASNYGSTAYVQAYFCPDLTWEEVNADENLKIAYGMAMWGFGAYDAATNTLTDATGAAHDLSSETLTAETYWNVIAAAYGYDLTSDEGINNVSAGSTMDTLLSDLFVLNEGSKEAEGGIPDISGITTGKVTCDDGVERDYVKVVLNGVDPVAIFQLGVTVAPFHYYTDGFSGTLDEHGVSLNDKEFIAHLKTKNNAPLGAGPYVFQSYKDNVVTYVANDSFLLGSPKIKNLRYQVISQGSELDSLKTGTVHYSDPSATTEIVNDVTEGSGDYAKLAYTLVDNDGYGYIGINAQFFPELEVRQAIAYSMNIQLTIDNWYEELASVNYRTMSKVCWAYPENPENLFPYDGTGAKSKELFLAAGYKYDEATNTMTYPDGHEKAGQQVTIKYTIPSDASEHPAGSVFLDSQKVLESIGVKVDIEIDQNVLDKLSTAYENGIQVWCAAWGNGGIDPDMFQVWYSDPSVNQGTSPAAKGLFWLYQNGSDEQKETLTKLNSLIIAGRGTLDQEERKAIYKEALELSTGLACEIPTYQRKNMFVYNKDVIKADTLLSGEDVTPFQSPLGEIWNVELN
ncbi:MAG: ABC transporter substrate-binding protein [Lachnospiraceae bacterium]|nr:ABC transporter substrate-binding protein [Lachnospiraceae bacterium]